MNDLPTIKRLNNKPTVAVGYYDHNGYVIKTQTNVVEVHDFAHPTNLAASRLLCGTAVAIHAKHLGVKDGGVVRASAARA